MASSKSLDRFEKLTRLATSPSPEEARSAAMAALKLIHAGAVVAVAADDPRLALPSCLPGEEGWDTTPWGQLVEREVMERFERMRQAFLASVPPPPPKPGEPGWEASPSGRWAIAEVGRLLRTQTELLKRAGRAPPKAPAPPAKRGARGGWVFFPSAQYGGPCVGACGQQLRPGTAIYWKRGVGIRCVACSESGEDAVEGGGR